MKSLKKIALNLATMSLIPLALLANAEPWFAAMNVGNGLQI